MFERLEAANARPAVFSKYTAAELWTEEHTSAQMLAYHLNDSVDVSSRRSSFIDESVAWMKRHFSLSADSRIVDFGCGPGLYTSRLASLDADIVGIDFSARSINYAREFAAANNLNVTYLEADYLSCEPEGEFDLITMIMCDFCALSPQQRAVMLSRFAGLLAPAGRVVLDVYSQSAFEDKVEAAYYEKNQLNGFWSAQPYYAFVSSFKYQAEQVSLDKYTIIERERTREVYNWLQHFTPQTLEREAASAGLKVEAIYADVAGHAFDADHGEFAVVLQG